MHEPCPYNSTCSKNGQLFLVAGDIRRSIVMPMYILLSGGLCVGSWTAQGDIHTVEAGSTIMVLV